MLVLKLNHVSKSFPGFQILCPLCWPGPWFSTKMLSYQYRKSRCGDKTVIRQPYLHSGISYNDKTPSFYWIKAQMMSIKMVDEIKRNHLYIKYLNIHLKTMSALSSEWNTAYWWYLHLAKQQAGFIILQSIPGLLMTHHCHVIDWCM